MTANPWNGVTVVILNGNKYEVPGGVSYEEHRGQAGDLSVTVFGKAETSGVQPVLGSLSGVEGCYMTATVAPSLPARPATGL